MKTQLKKKQESNTKPVKPQHYRQPLYEVNGHEGGYDVEIQMPGVSRSGATVTLEKGTLTVEGSVAESAPENWRCLHRELADRDFRLQLQLNVEVAKDAITARTVDGVLKVTLPIAEAARPRSITIE